MAVPHDFKGWATALSPTAIIDAAKRIDVPEANLRAILVCETGGRAAFAADGRPAILYEAHVAHRLNGGRDVPGLAVAKWDRTLYARTTAGEYDRLQAAIDHPDIGRDVALKSASWGLPQILGLNHALCGFDSAEAFGAAMCDGADAQIAAMLAFLAARKIIAPLAAGDWDEVGRLYNGSSYRENHYAERLADAAAHAELGARDGLLGPGDLGPDVAEVQRRLPGLVADGDFGSRTRIAVERLQADRGLPVTGMIDSATAAVLGLSAPRGAVQPTA